MGEETSLKKRKVLLYYNAYSGNGTFKNNLDHIIDRCQNVGFQVIPVRTKHGVMIDKVLGEINPEEYDRIIVAGGDGTSNTLVKTMMKYDIHLPIGILPSGTANDFAYYFNVPSDLDMALDIALGERTTTADVGLVNDKYFINVCAMGTMVDVSQRTDPAVKNALGPLAYYLKAATELPQLHAIPVKLTTDDEVFEEEIYFLTVLNGESAGGFRKLSPQSRINDGKLNVVAFRKMPILEFAPLLFEVINGRHPENKNVLYFLTSKLKIESPQEVSTDVDGQKGPMLPLEFSVLKERLQIFVSETSWEE